jgi:hypothetical protein
MRDAWGECAARSRRARSSTSERWRLANAVWDEMRGTTRRTAARATTRRRCRAEAVRGRAVKQHKKFAAGKATCIDCHTGVAHKEPEEPKERRRPKRENARRSRRRSGDRRGLARAPRRWDQGPIGRGSLWSARRRPSVLVAAQSLTINACREAQLLPHAAQPGGFGAWALAETSDGQATTRGIGSRCVLLRRSPAAAAATRTPSRPDTPGPPAPGRRARGGARRRWSGTVGSNALTNPARSRPTQASGPTWRRR